MLDALTILWLPLAIAVMSVTFVVALGSASPNASPSSVADRDPAQT
jgi:hypothetical protein